MSDFFALSEEHQAIREAVRAVAESEDRPVRRRRRRAGALPAGGRPTRCSPRTSTPRTCPSSTAEPAPTRSRPSWSSRRSPASCVSSSLIPAVNKLGSLPVQIGGNEEIKAKYLGKLARGEGGFSLLPVRARGRLRRRQPEDDRAVATATTGSSTASKRWITNAGVSEYYTVLAQTDPDEAHEGHHGVRRREVRRGRLVRRAREEARHQGLADARGLLRQRAHPRRPHHRRGRRGLLDRDEDARPHARHDRRAGRRRRPGRARLRARLRPGAQAVRQARSRTSRACSSWSPTWA